MTKMDALLARIGSSEVPVLIQGETGAGKEVLARRIHAQSPRAGKSFWKLNCAALPPELVESELFGYERGAFTGASQNKPGMFELADGATLLLDEIGDMDFKLQAKLLQVLQDQEFRPLGGKEIIRVNVRVIAATHRDLADAIAEGRFREDLYYRLTVITLRVPALRERKSEILPLAESFLDKYATPEMPAPVMTAPIRQALLDHDWPGNIRELENFMRRCLVFGDMDMMAEELRSNTRRRQLDRPAGGAKAVSISQAQPGATALSQIEVARVQAESETILEALHATRWNRKKAAKLLDIDYKALLYKMRKLGIEERNTVVMFPEQAAEEVESPEAECAVAG